MEAGIGFLCPLLAQRCSARHRPAGGGSGGARPQFRGCWCGESSWLDPELVAHGDSANPVVPARGRAPLAPAHGVPAWVLTHPALAAPQRGMPVIASSIASYAPPASPLCATATATTLMDAGRTAIGSRADRERIPVAMHPPPTSPARRACPAPVERPLSPTPVARLGLRRRKSSRLTHAGNGHPGDPLGRCGLGATTSGRCIEI